MKAESQGVVQRVAQSMGLGPIEGSAVQLLTRDAEYRLQEVVQEALKFMKRTGRTQLAAEDVRLALALKENASVPSHFPTWSGPVHSASPEGQTIIRLDDVLQQPCPRSYEPSPTISCHWLVVNGVQPCTAANPPATPSDAFLAPRSPPPSTGTETEPASSSPVQRTESLRRRVRQAVSQEQLDYFLKVTSLLSSQSSEAAAVAQALAGLERHCVAPLAPFLVQFFHEDVLFRLDDVPALRSLVALLNALHRNPNVPLGPHLAQVMEPLLTCVTGADLGHGGDDHWALRKEAGSLLAALCLQHSDEAEDLLPRMVRTLLHTLLAPGSCLSAHYGALVTLAQLGPEAIYQLFLQGHASEEMGSPSENACTLVQYTRWLFQHRRGALQQRLPPAPLLFAIDQCYNATLSLAVQFLRGVCKSLREVELSARAEGTHTSGKLRRLESLVLPPAISALYASLYETFGEPLLCRLKSPVSAATEVRRVSAVVDDDIVDEVTEGPPQGAGKAVHRRFTVTVSRAQRDGGEEGKRKCKHTVFRWRLQRVRPPSEPAAPPKAVVWVPSDWLANAVL